MNPPKSAIELGCMCPRGLLGQPAVTFTKQLKNERRLLSGVYTILNRI